MDEPRKTRPVSWIKAALKDFEAFPRDAQSPFLAALTIEARRRQGRHRETAA